MTDPLGHTTTYTYDADGNQTSVNDALGRVTTYTYDALNRLTMTTYPDGTTTSTTYDFRGNPLTETDQAGHVTLYTYDQTGQTTSVTTADGTPDSATTTYTYDAAGLVTQVTDPLGHNTAYTYDAADYVQNMTDALGAVTTYTHNNAGQVATETDPLGHQTSYSYDARGRVVMTTYADGTTTQQSYDGQGNVLSSTDQNGIVTSYSYDALGHVLSVITASGTPDAATTSYTYDANGNLLTIADANNHTTGYAYDADNQQTKKTWPDGSFELFGYDAVGNQTSHQLTGGHTDTSTYDVLNRLSKLTYFDGTSVSYTYTPTGKSAIVKDSRGTTQYTYDNQDRLIKITTPSGQSVTYAYDAAGNRVGLGTPAGSISYSYDDGNRLASVSSQGVGTFTYSYDKAGNRTQLALPNGITVGYGYDALNRLTSLKQTLGSQTLASYIYTLDPAGNRTKVVNADGSSVSWTYDDAYRLTGETDTDASGAVTYQASYSYDKVGDRTSATIYGQTIHYSYNALDQLTSVGNATFSYDGRGNLVQIQNGSSVTYTYNAANELTSATEPGGASVSYAYDAAGRRVQQTVGSSITNYLWDEASTNGDVVLETDGSGATQASYVLGNDQVLAETRSGATSYYLDDGQGSVRNLTDSSGAVTDSYTYDAFGNAQSSTGSTINPYRYTGQQFDSLTGLYDLRARYYDPSTGSFTSRDTVQMGVNDPRALNPYAYASADPVNYSDPSGHNAVALPPAALPRPATPGLGEYVALLTISLIVAAALAFIGTYTRCMDMWVTSLLMALDHDGPGLVGLNGIDPGTPPPCHIPVLEYPWASTPTIAHHIQDAQAGLGSHPFPEPMLLQYIGSRNPQRRTNYQAACGHWTPPPGAGINTSCDEYPFETSTDGGVLASIRGVPAAEQNQQGGILTRFYRRNLWPLGPFFPNNRTWGTYRGQGHIFAAVVVLFDVHS
jgi:RHS repeat-associated protein